MDELRLPFVEELPPGFVPLRLVLQPDGTFIELNRPDMLLGRHTEADVRLPLLDVSRRHCRVQFVEGGWQVLDLNSLNGVWVNGVMVQQAFLKQDDILRIGGFTFAVDLTGARPNDATEFDGSDGLLKSIFQSLPPPDEALPRRRAS
jgi:pSer/pThr/pTyr-binding forkhead associated (FHA) protein